MPLLRGTTSGGQALHDEELVQFLALMHLAAWDASTVSWKQRGIEHAADVIAWA